VVVDVVPELEVLRHHRGESPVQRAVHLARRERRARATTIGTADLALRSSKSSSWSTR
jgi:hypothetical protein